MFSCVFGTETSSMIYVFFFSSRRRHTRLQGDWSSDVCSSDLGCQRSALDPVWRGQQNPRSLAVGCRLRQEVLNLIERQAVGGQRYRFCRRHGVGPHRGSRERVKLSQVFKRARIAVVLHPFSADVTVLEALSLTAGAADAKEHDLVVLDALRLGQSVKADI